MVSSNVSIDILINYSAVRCADSLHCNWQEQIGIYKKQVIVLVKWKLVQFWVINDDIETDCWVIRNAANEPVTDMTRCDNSGGEDADESSYETDG